MARGQKTPLDRRRESFRMSRSNEPARDHRRVIRDPVHSFTGMAEF